MKKVAVIVAHGDDETLGCGGTIARHTNERDGDDETDSVFMLVLAAAASSIRASKQMTQCHQVRKVLGITQVYESIYVDQKMDKEPFLKIIQSVEHFIKVVDPDIIYTHHIGDLNLDHQITARAVLTAARPVPGSKVKEIYGMEVLSSTEWGIGEPFRPTHYVDIEGYVEIKNKAMLMYEGEVRPMPHARSIAAINSKIVSRGAEVGLKFAEAFHVYRQIR